MSDVWDIRIAGTPEQITEYHHWEAVGEAWISSGTGDTYQHYEEQTRERYATPQTGVTHRYGETGTDEEGQGMRDVTDLSCPQCEGKFTPQHPTAKFCSKACKQKAYRLRLISAT